MDGLHVCCGGHGCRRMMHRAASVVGRRRGRRHRRRVGMARVQIRAIEAQTAVKSTTSSSSSSSASSSSHPAETEAGKRVMAGKRHVAERSDVGATMRQITILLQL